MPGVEIFEAENQKDGACNKTSKFLSEKNLLNFKEIITTCTVVLKR